MKTKAAKSILPNNGRPPAVGLFFYFQERGETLGRAYSSEAAAMAFDAHFELGNWWLGAGTLWSSSGDFFISLKSANWSGFQSGVKLI